MPKGTFLFLFISKHFFLFFVFFYFYVASKQYLLFTFYCSTAVFICNTQYLKNDKGPGFNTCFNINIPILMWRSRLWLQQNIIFIIDSSAN